MDSESRSTAIDLIRNDVFFIAHGGVGEDDEAIFEKTLGKPSKTRSGR